MKFLPIRFHIIYITFTLLINFYGPKVYDDYNRLYVFLFILAYLVCVWIGFSMGLNSNVFYNKSKRIDFQAVLRKSINLSIVLFLINFIYLFSTGRISFSISELGQNYSNFYEYYYNKTESATLTFELVFLVISAIPKFICLALGFYYFDKLKTSFKIRFIFFLLLIVLTQTFSLGNQKSIGDIVIFGLITILIKAIKLSRSKRRKMVRNMIVLLVALFTLLSYSQYTRVASRDITLMDINDNMAYYSHYDLDHPIFEIFGREAGLGISQFLSGYLSNGYYGLSKALEMETTWSYGVGNSVTLTAITQLITGVDYYQFTYLNQMEVLYGIPGKRHWHTIFPWLASDFTFPGTIFLFFIISFYYGKTWQEVIRYQNPVSLCLFSLLTIMFIFVPANNQILHGYDYFIVTIFVAVFWKLYHNNYNILVR